VTIATVLIASQAVLCAVIGWVTFGGREQAGGSAARAAEPDLGPALVVPPVSVAPVTTSPTAHRPRRSTPTPSAKPSRTPPRVPPAPPRSTATKTTSPAATKRSSTRSPEGAVVVKPTPSASEVQGNAVVGAKCSPAGAEGVTVLGLAVRCRSDRSGDLIWQLV